MLWLQYTFDELLDIVQVSEDELRQALTELKACLIHGKFACNPLLLDADCYVCCHIFS